MKYLISILAAFLVVLAAATYSLYETKRVLNAQLNEANAKYELIKSHIDSQNEAVQKANEQLQGYETKIMELELDYQIKIKNFQKEIANVKTCEDGMKYLKKLLESEALRNEK